MPLPYIAGATIISALAALSVAVRQWVGPLQPQPLTPPQTTPLPAQTPVTTTPATAGTGFDWGGIARAIASLPGSVTGARATGAAQAELERMRRETESYTAAVAAETQRVESQRALLTMGIVGVLAIGGLVWALKD